MSSGIDDCPGLCHRREKIGRGIESLSSAPAGIAQGEEEGEREEEEEEEEAEEFTAMDESGGEMAAVEVER